MIYRNLQEGEENPFSEHVATNPTVTDSSGIKNSNTFKPIIMVTDTEQNECIKDVSVLLECPPKTTESVCLTTLNENDEVTHFVSNAQSSSCNLQVQEDQISNPGEKKEIWGNLKLF